MKKTALSASLLLLGFANILSGQFTQAELFSGSDKTDFTLFSNHPLNRKRTLQLSTLAFFQKFHEIENQGFDEAGIQPTLYWNLTENISVGPSLYYNSFAGYSQRLSSKFTFNTARLLIVVIPTVAYSNQKNAGLAETFAQFQWNTPLNSNLSLWLNGQFLTVWDKFKTHSRSFQQLRGGVAFHGHQLGVGFDFDQFGPDPINKSTFGIYYRKTL